MTVKNCKKCGSLFNYIAGDQLCPRCKEEIEKKFSTIKEYIREHSNVTISDIVKEFDVPESQIRAWVKAERLVFSGGIDAGAYCENCGTPIATGRFCDKCKAETIRGLNGLLPKEEKAPIQRKQAVSAKMRFLDNR